MDNLFIQISLLLFVAVGSAFILRLLKQPLIVAYILTGIVCGPFFLNLIHGDGEVYNVFAKFGVVLLLFIIGLNLNFSHLRSIGKVSLFTGFGQVIFTAVIGTGILLTLNFSLITAVCLSLAMTFSSTIIIMKLLTEKKDTETIYGRYTIGLMLVQDILAVFLIIALGFLKSELIGAQPILFLFSKMLLAGAGIYLVSRYLLPKILDRVSSSGELLFLFTLTWCFGLASLFYKLGLSLEIGAIVSGLTLSASPYQLEISSRVKPLRDFFLIIFFIVLGSEMAMVSLVPVMAVAVILSLFILIGNPFILYILLRWQKFTRRNSFLVGLTAAQVSEFGFVLLFAGRELGLLTGLEVPIFTFVALLTIFASSYLITYNEKIYRLLLPVFNFFGPDKFRQRNNVNKVYDAWVIGYHRIGIKVAEALAYKKIKYSVIDFDPQAIYKLRKNKVPFFYGDIADVEFLESLPITRSKMIIMTVPATDDQINLLNHVKKTNPQVLIIANAYEKEQAQELYAHGADFVMMPHLLGGHWIGKILRYEKINNRTFVKLKKEQDTMRL
ncbi:MAG: cation:proton antiporter [Patescibacteria group bacterium]